MKTIKIEVFGTKSGKKDWILLPGTTAYLNEAQIIPNIGDSITITRTDGVLVDLEKADFKHIQTVKRKWYNYASSDLAILLEYQS